MRAGLWRTTVLVIMLVATILMLQALHQQAADSDPAPAVQNQEAAPVSAADSKVAASGGAVGDLELRPHSEVKAFQCSMDHAADDNVVLARLMKFCIEGNEINDPMMITRHTHLIIGKNWSEDEMVEIYLNTCYPFEASFSQGARSTGHCADFMLYVLHAGARLTTGYSDEVVAEKMRRCPNSTYLWGEYPDTRFFNKHPQIRNFWMPNLEQILEDQALLFNRTHTVIAKNKFAESTIKKYLVDKKIDGVNVIRPGHTTPDVVVPDTVYMNPTYEVDRNMWFHSKGGSVRKGTDEVINCWLANPTLPKITIVGRNMVADFMRNHGEKTKPKNTVPDNMSLREFVDAPELRRLQLVSGVHVCPSVMEGYGHYIQAAKAASAVVITTDFPPMNEYVENGVSGVTFKAGPAMKEEYMAMPNPRTSIKWEDLCVAVKKVVEMSVEEREKMGRRARERFEEDTREMVRNLAGLRAEALTRLEGRAFLVEGDEAESERRVYEWEMEMASRTVKQCLDLSISRKRTKSA